MDYFLKVKKKYEEAISTFKDRLQDLNEELQMNYAECKVLAEINVPYCKENITILRNRQTEIEKEIRKLEDLISFYQRIVSVANIKSKEQENKAEN